MTFDIPTIIQILGPAIAVYAAIRADMAAMHVRLDHLERDTYPSKINKPKQQS